MSLIPNEQTHAHNKSKFLSDEHKTALPDALQKLTETQPRMPYVGEIVLFKANPDDTIAHSNMNTDEIAAIITRVWSYGCVNIKIIPDHGAMQDRGSVTHHSLNPAGYHFKFLNE